MSLFSKLFGGGGAASAPEPETYEGFRIFPEPIKESGGFRLGARIEKEVGGETRVHQLIRADVFQSEDEAMKFSVSKAKQMIDQMGEGLFG
ncbi:MAG: transcriptional activator HlyU [Myxococcales bacterium]|nr:transcriptional activator HlyU [Myxococcales bacterium]